MMMVTSSSASNELLRSSPVHNVLKLDKLPAVVFNEMLSYFTYEELCSLRPINQFFKRVIDKRLNDSFLRLGRELSELSLMLKRRLPRKESERKEHPMNRYVEIISSLETRYTLLSMTYKKYIDAGLACFPGKVLDLSYQVLYMIRGYVQQNVYVQLNTISILKDIRDYSTMSIEHFDLHIAPILSKRLQPPDFLRRSFETTGRLYNPMFRATSFLTGIYTFGSLPKAIEYDSDNATSNQASVSKLSEKLDVQGKQIEDIRKLIDAQNNVIMNISGVLNEVTKVVPAHSRNFTELLHQMTSSATNLQEMLLPLISSSSKRVAPRQKPSEWLSKRIPESPALLSSPSSVYSNTSVIPKPSKPTLLSITSPRYEFRKRKSPNRSNTENKGIKRKRV